MLKNFIKTALRNLVRNKTFSIINIAGLAIGMSCAALIFMWVNDELSFDNFHQNKDQIYRIWVQRNDTNDIWTTTPGLLAAAVKSKIPEIKYAARLMQNHRNPYKYQDKAFYEEHTYCADPDFFKMFDFPIVQGNVASPLEHPNNIVITEKVAWKYFGDENPVGKTLNWNNWADYQVSAVLKDIPANSHLQTQLVESHGLSERFWRGGYNWTNFVHTTYIQVEENSHIKEIEKKIENILNENYTTSDRYYEVRLQPLADIHLNASIPSSFAVTGDRTYVTIFSIIAIGILLIACVNFINISTATSMTRAKEVAIRKVVGIHQKRLVFQFMGESAILTFIASLLAAIVIDLALPYFNQFTGKELSLDSRFYLFFFIIFLFTALFAGSYPALHLSAFSPLVLLKTISGSSKQRISLRSALVIFQFLISILLISCTLFINHQMNYIQNKKMGFDRRLSRLFTWFSFLAIFISCLGLYGLATFVASKRTKEIGIRKVMGSTVANIVLLLSKSFLRWVLFANLLAWPIAWYAMNKWLQDFAYRINITIWPFIWAGLAALLIALATLSCQAIRAGKTNPVKALRYE